MSSLQRKPPIDALTTLRILTREQRAELKRLLPEDNPATMAEHWAWVSIHKILIRSGLTASALNRQVETLVETKQVKARGLHPGTTRGEVKPKDILIGRVRK